MYIDTHCHVNFQDYDRDRTVILGNAKKAGVKRFLCPGADIPSSMKAIELTKTYPGVLFASVGIHPYEAQHNPDITDVEILLRHNMTTSKHHIVGIGECGLDYHQYKDEAAQGKKDMQKKLFKEHLLLALKYQLPVIMHCRDAYEDFFDILDSLPSVPHGVLHCFMGGLQELRMAQDRNLFIGIDGNVTYHKQLSFIVPHIPLTMLLLETDAPYLTPVPHRGTRNEPKYIPLIAKHISLLLHCKIQEIESRTTQNAGILFGI